eukprot:scaffold43634_cov64-Phaeocystis_antarctica.AAC.2
MRTLRAQDRTPDRISRNPYSRGRAGCRSGTCRAPRSTRTSGSPLPGWPRLCLRRNSSPSPPAR